MIACSGLFVFVGPTANSTLLASAVQRDAAGSVVTNARFETAIPGVFARYGRATAAASPVPLPRPPKPPNAPRSGVTCLMLRLDRA